MKHRRLSARLLAMLLLLVMTALPARAHETHAGRAFRHKGEMVVATEGAWAPWTYHDEQGTSWSASTLKWRRPSQKSSA